VLVAPADQIPTDYIMLHPVVTGNQLLLNLYTKKKITQLRKHL